MKRRFTIFSRLAAGLLTVMLALPNYAWAGHIVSSPQYVTTSLYEGTGNQGSSEWDLDSVTTTSKSTIMAPIYKRKKVTSTDHIQGYYYQGYDYWWLPIAPGTDTLRHYYSMKAYTDNTY